MINAERSYTEYAVVVPTTDFVVGYDFIDNGVDITEVTINGVDPTTIGYTVLQVNNTTYRFAPAVPSGVVRLTRITDIDQMAHVFTEGAIFISENMDGNFKQIRHAQQEVRDNFGVLQRDFSGLEDTVLPLVGGLEVALQAAESAATAAGEAADIAVAVQTDIAQKFPNGKLKAVDVLNASTETQQEINDFGGAKWYTKVGGYKLGANVKLDNGDTVKSTAPNNTVNPNVDMTGWVYDYLASGANKNLKHYTGADPNGVLNTSPALQMYVNDVNTQRLSVLYAPTVWENYVIDDKIVCEYPISIKGDKGPNQNRYFGKKGNFLIGDTPVGFTFGNGRADYPEVTYIADQYNVQNIGFLQKDGEFTKTAIVWHVRTNAPDRGLLLREVSASRLDKFFHLKSGAATDLANLVIENSCLSNCHYVVYSEGALNGLRFVGNQSEQNVYGTLHGCFNGAVYIADNMLEGSFNTLNIQPVPVTGSRTKINLERNYIEHNVGDYLLNVNSTVAGHLTIKDNFFFDVNAREVDGSLTDVVKIQGVFDYIDNTDNFSLTLDSLFSIIAEPNFSRSGAYNVRVNASNYNIINLVTSENISKLKVTNGAYPTYILPSVKTNLGDMYYISAFGGSRITVPKSIQAGDIMKLTVTYYDEYTGDLQNTPISVNVNDAALSVGASGLMNMEACRDRIKVASFVFLANFNSPTTTKVYFGASAFGATYILNCDLEKIGASTAAEDKVKTALTMPKLLEVRDGITFSKSLDASSGVEVPANGSSLVYFNVANITTDHKIDLWLNNPHPSIRIAVDSISASDIVVRFYNSSDSVVALTNDILKMNVK